MKKISVIKNISLLLVIVFGLPWIQSSGFSAVGAVSHAQDGPEIDPELLQQFSRSESVDYFIYFDAKADLSLAFDTPWEERGQFVYERLTEVASTSQKSVRAYLDSQSVSYEAFWIANVIAVRSSSRTTFDQVRTFSGVQAITTIPTIQLIEPVTIKEEATQSGIRAVETNLTHINADDAWALGYRGDNMVIGSIDTGVHYTHETLVKQYRGNLGGANFDHAYNWWDAVNNQLAAYDDNNHGTHTVGIMVGDDGAGNQIGVAPAAQWIACKAFASSGLADADDLLDCGQFMTAPTDLGGDNPNPDMRPNAVNNSWGDCAQAYDDWYEDTIDAWLAAGIYPLFANGNAGGCGYSYPPGQNTVGNPARSYHVTGVGSTGRNNGEYASHSTWGPTDSLDTLNPMGYADMKPQVVAPGVSIRSSVASSDSAYAQFTGTSMSTPHVAGLVALMWDAASCLIGDYVTTETILQQSAVPIYYDDSGDGSATYPNYATGWGEINAEAAVSQARDHCGDAHLVGHVYDAGSGDPIAGALVEAQAHGDSGNDRSNETDQDGAYNLSVFSNETYDISASHYGYQSQTKTKVVSSPGDTVVTNFNLNPLQQVDLSGVVSDGNGHGYPLYATLLFEAAGHSQAIFNDPFTGDYAITLYESTPYDVTVNSEIRGYQSLAAAGLTFTSPSDSRNFQLPILTNCSAPGYEAVGGLSEIFPYESLPDGWTVMDHAGTGAVWRFDDPAGRTNLTGGSGPFAIIDSDYAGFVEIDSSLVSPSVDMSLESEVFLSFDQDFNHWSAEVADVDVSIDGGSTWDNVLRQTSSVRGPDHQEIDISSHAANQADVRVRFRYYSAEFEYWWQVDNVAIRPFTCNIVAGGVMAGFVRSEHTSRPLNGAKIEGDNTFNFSRDTFFDADLPDGFYWLFQAMSSNPQSVVFEISRPAFITLVETVELNQGAVNRKDFDLDSSVRYFPLFTK